MMSEFDSVMSSIEEKVDFHTEQYNSPVTENEEHSHTSGGTYFGDSVSDTASLLSDTDTQAVVVKEENVQEQKEVSSFDYFIFFGLIIMAVILLINKIRSKRQ